MNYKLPRPAFDKRIMKILSEEVRRQDIYVVRASKKHLKEMAGVVQAIQKQELPPYLVRKKLPKGLGYGIFLHPQAPPILKGQIIAPYAGEVFFVPQNLPEDSLYAFEPFSDVTLSKEQQACYDPQRRYRPQRLYALQIDAQKKGNFTRFINHSDKPNIIADFFRVPSNAYGLTPSPIEVVYLAKKTIRPGEQLLVDYDGDGSNSYWAALKIKPISITPQTFRLDASLKLIGSV